MKVNKVPENKSKILTKSKTINFFYIDGTFPCINV